MKTFSEEKDKFYCHTVQKIQKLFRNTGNTAYFKNSLFRNSVFNSLDKSSLNN